jgi:N-methylhydantoinase A
METATSMASQPISSPAQTYRIGVDIGGTFTDVVAVDEQSGAFHVVKVPTTPADPSQGFLDGLTKTFDRFGIAPGSVSFAVHGTTIATNTIIEGKGAPAGLITSEGFSDVLEIGYQTRPALYDVFYEKPKPLVPRDRCIGVPERIAADGTVLVPLDEAAVEAAARQLHSQGVKAIAIAFLHAYRDPTHERRAAAAIARATPGIPVVLSSDVCPEYREYPRTSTTVVNAVLQPKVGPYISRLEDRLAAQGLTTGLHLMTSSGGIIAAAAAKALPVHLVESGPAAGVIGAAFVAGRLAQSGIKDRILALDIGGTTAKVALVDDGEPLLADEFEVGAAARPTTTNSRGQGYPVKTPVISLVEIGAGGGSIARIDPGGALTVGPESAGAVPGPACYGKGGARPTITDANLVLGRLDPAFFLGGALLLDLQRARDAIASDIATPLGIGIEDAAQAIVDIANAKMIAALEFISIQRGIDPRDYALVPSGGAGPLHAVAIAKTLGLRIVIIPPTPGLNSALGLLATDVKHDFVRTLYSRTLRLAPDALWSVLDEMAEAGDRLLSDNGVPHHRREIRREAELCYVGQSYALKLSVPPERATTLTALDTAFRTAHQHKYGFASQTEPTLIANLRITAIGRVDRPKLGSGRAGTGAATALKGHRIVHFGGPIATPVYDRTRLGTGDIIDGPAIIEQMDTSTVLPPETEASVDASGSLVITIR